jgi:uncharacterized membrane protein
VIGLVRFVYLLALAVWVGEIVFFSFIVAPAVFGVLEGPRAGAVVGAIFPRYYALGAVAGVVAIACALVLARRATVAGWWTAAVVALALGLAATLWAGLVVAPRTQRLRVALEARGQTPSADEGFARAHRAAVALNGTALLAGLVGLGLSAAGLRQ